MDRELPVELDPPDGVDDAAEAVELMRAWICDGALLVALNSSAFGDHVADWGRLLAEVGHHIAKAAALNGYMPEDGGAGDVARRLRRRLRQLSPGASGRLKGRQEH